MIRRSGSSPWSWVPTLYFAEGVPFILATAVAAVMFKNLGMPNAELAFWTGLLGLPWVLKPLWTPVVDIYFTKRRWIVGTELGGGAVLLAAALTLPLPGVGVWTVMAAFGLLAVISATHDAAADGFYLIGLDSHEQAWFTGVRSTFYRLAMIAVQGALVMAAGALIDRLGRGDAETARAWAAALAAAGALVMALGVWHAAVLPRRETAAAGAGAWAAARREFALAFVSFFQKHGVWRLLAFLLLYRLAEALLVKLAAPFILDEPGCGGLGISTAGHGLVYGTVGVICLTLGGLAGGWLAARFGLGRMLWPMALAINLPDIVYLAMALWRPSGLAEVAGLVGLEQLGYGFGFTAYTLAMVAFAESSGRFRTSHFAIMTGFMALGMQLPGMAAGVIQEWLGYPGFFGLVMLCTVPAAASVLLLRGLIRSDFGRKNSL